MQIFDVEIFGSCADWFMEQSCEGKKEWIKKNANVTSDVLIDEFIKSCNRGNDDECLGCKKSKQNATNNISVGVSEKEPSVSTIGENQTEGRTTNVKRSKRNNKESQD